MQQMNSEFIGVRLFCRRHRNCGLSPSRWQCLSTYMAHATCIRKSKHTRILARARVSFHFAVCNFGRPYAELSWADRQTHTATSWQRLRLSARISNVRAGVCARVSACLCTCWLLTGLQMDDRFGVRCMWNDNNKNDKNVLCIFIFVILFACASRASR